MYENTHTHTHTHTHTYMWKHTHHRQNNRDCSRAIHFEDAKQELQPLSILPVMSLTFQVILTSASRHIIIDLCFTHPFSNSYNNYTNNNVSDITLILLWIHTHVDTHTDVLSLIRTHKIYVYMVCFHIWFLIALLKLCYISAWPAITEHNFF